jgi:hypothetical protein
LITISWSFSFLKTDTNFAWIIVQVWWSLLLWRLNLDEDTKIPCSLTFQAIEYSGGAMIGFWPQMKPQKYIEKIFLPIAKLPIGSLYIESNVVTVSPCFDQPQCCIFDHKTSILILCVEENLINLFLSSWNVVQTYISPLVRKSHFMCTTWYYLIISLQILSSL